MQTKGINYNFVQINNPKLTPTQIGFLCGLINNCGTGQHPIATPQGLHFFYTSYAIQLMCKPKVIKVTSTAGKAMWQTILPLL